MAGNFHPSVHRLSLLHPVIDSARSAYAQQSTSLSAWGERERECVCVCVCVVCSCPLCTCACSTSALYMFMPLRNLMSMIPHRSLQSVSCQWVTAHEKMSRPGQSLFVVYVTTAAVTVTCVHLRTISTWLSYPRCLPSGLCGVVRVSCCDVTRGVHKMGGLQPKENT